MAKKTAEFALRLVWTGGVEFGGVPTQGGAYSREWTTSMTGKPAIRGSSPAAFGGDDALPNPEDMLMASLSSCHMLSYLSLCARKGVRVACYESDAKGTMTFDPAIKTFRFSSVAIYPKVQLVPDATDEEQQRAVQLHEDAHNICFIGQSVNFPVEVQPSVTKRLISSL